MSKKNLLNESTIRRFVKLANVGTLAEDFYKENSTSEELAEEEGLEPDMPADMGPDEEPPMDMEPELEPEPEAEDLAQRVATAVADALSDVLGIEVSVEGGEEDMDLPPEEETDLPPEEETDLPPEEEEPPMAGRDMYEELNLNVVDDESVVSEVFKRVVSRLAEKKKDIS